MLVSNIILIFLIFEISLCNSYRILAIFPFTGRNHNNVLQPMAMTLANKGHQVDVITYFPLKEPVPNYTDVVKLPLRDYPRISYEFVVDRDKEHKWLGEQTKNICSLLGHPQIANLIKNPPTNPSYDLLLVHFLSGDQCLAAIGYHWDIPVAGVITTAPYPQLRSFIGEPLNLAVYPNHYGLYKDKLNFWDRLYNVIKTHEFLYKYHKHMAVQDDYIKKYISDDMPSYRELETKVSILFSNSHYSFYGVKPKIPALIEIGGINIKNDSSTLSPSLKKYLNESKHGFIYFSFGSLLAIETLPNDIIERFYNVFRKVSPVRILMRAPQPDALPKNLPDNVLVHTWLPQQQILQHPNIKAFVSHGGGLGTQEAIYYKIPMICVPFFAEQYTNCGILSHKNTSIVIDIRTAEQDDYDNVFQEILTNPLYKISMKKFSSLYWDRTRSPQDEVTYWIEYVIRHGKNVLRSPAVDLKWWQIDLLDVYAFILISTIIFLFVLIIIIKSICSLFVRKLFSRIMIANKIINSSKKLN